MSVRRQMEELDTIVDVSKLTPTERRKWSKFIADIPAQQENAAMAVVAARVFYSTANLRELAKLARDPREREQVRRLIEAISRVDIGGHQQATA